MERSALYRTIWRWHFYAGLLVIPFVLILSVTGAIYLFKPQVERWEERAWQGLPTAGAVSPDAQRDAVLAAFPGAKFHGYRLPQEDGDAVLLHVGLPGRQGMRDVFVSPQGKAVGVLDPETRVMQVVHDIHGELLLGSRGSWLVELAASWAIVMLLSGLYLWWPQGRGPSGWILAGVAWPRLRRGKQVFWRDLHAVTGFWVAGLALVLLVTGLPWAGVWGSAFKSVRQELGWVKGQNGKSGQDWTLGGKAPAPSAADDADPHAVHREHDHAAMIPARAPMDHVAHGMSPVLLSEVVARAQSEHLAFPVTVAPGQTGWTVQSDAQNRPLRVKLTYDPITGTETSREDFARKHAIDRVVGYGIAWHEGQLLGWFNQVVGLLTALMLTTLAVSGLVMWRRRKPEGLLGAPPLPPVPTKIGGVVAIVLLLAALLPMLTVSLVVLWAVERLVLTRIAPVSRWLGLARPRARAIRP